MCLSILFNDETIEDLAKEVLDELEPVEAKPAGKIEGTTTIIKSNSIQQFSFCRLVLFK